MKKLIIPMLAVLLLALSACGRGRQNEPNVNGGEVTPPAEVIRDFDGGSLSIFTPFGGLSRLEEAASNANIQANFTSYMQDDWLEYNQILLSMFAAGHGPDIFIRDGFLLYPFIEHGFIANIYDIIDRSSVTNREEFFTNVLEGLETGGQLYTLPTQFSIEYIGINIDVPQEFSNRFLALDRVSPSDMFALQRDLVAQHPQWAEFALVHGFNNTQAFTPEINMYVDFAQQSVNFSAMDASFLYSIRDAFYGNNRFETSFLNMWTLEDDLATKQERYIFSRSSGSTGAFLGLLEFRNPFFLYRPLADESGRLVNRSWGTEFVVSQTADPNLVMGFFAQFVYDQVHQDFRFGVDIPILRRYFLQAIDSGFHHTLTQMSLPPTVESESFAIQTATAQLEELASWPSITMHGNVIYPGWPALSVLMPFFEGDQPAAEALAELDAAFMAWFDEEAAEIAEFVPEEEFILPDLPIRTLTIRNDNRHTGVIEQAALALNQQWRDEDRPYIFNIEIEDHSWIDFEDFGGRLVRLSTELMAGQGPDMFLFAHHDLHVLANSGFLQDFYTLMDICPNTSRDEFFTQPLQAFEVNNSLYLLPVSFGFDYISINANLPQEFIDRFTQKSHINLTEMMAFYLDLMDAHGDEFGDLIFHTGGIITQSHSVLQSAMGSFVDFNNRTANLTDPSFVQTLELMAIVYEDWELDMTWGIDVATPAFLRERAEEYVFFAISSGVANFDAFFTPETPIFHHHIPLTDSSGRLTLNPPGDHGQVWSGLMVTTLADGELAWEFARHLIHAYANPVGMAALEPVFGSRNTWGQNSLATPIERALFRDHAMLTFEDMWNRHYMNFQNFIGFDDDAERLRQFEAAIDRIAAYNEQPMAMFMPGLPFGLISDHFDQFQRGLITAETAAQRMNNAITLWLLEQ